ncbi:hypothetical protein CAEBREN_15807 [Caenorhabditis brenneri]|uniref:Calpain catalytic domain-containing protein n=1 Tax=Caenorhabditis brenneri TaxID=135651 RepID=G0NC28_CAEBE|nr:hypothetical protein CAEBREN_15807 [Caenorhabditis brenneri]
MSAQKKIDKNAEQTRIDSIRAKFLEHDDLEDELKYQTIVEYCRENKTTFHDGEFVHCDENLGKWLLKEWKGPSAVQKVKKKLKKDRKEKQDPDPKNPIPIDEKWHRLAPNLESSNTWEFYVPTFEYEVFQCGLENCGLIASLSAVSAHRSILNFMFRDLSLNEFGVYQVNLCVDGEWKTITVDDWVPCVRGVSKSAGFTCINGTYQIWPGIVEKAIAKVFGGYQDLRGFDSLRALQMMTGAPGVLYHPQQFDIDELWRILMEARSKNFQMTCGTSKPSNERKYNKKVKKLEEPEIARGHGYTILAVREFNEHKLLRLRNPWGRSEWNGRFSMNWTGWSAYMIWRLLLSYRFVCGSFWMELDQFVKFFDIFTICRYRDSWYVIRLRMVIGGVYDGSQKAIRISVPAACEIAVSSFLPNQGKSRYHSWIIIYQIHDSEEVGPVILAEPISPSTEDIKLQPGDYMIIVSAFPTSKNERNVSIHSSIPVSARISDWNPVKIAEIMQKAVREMGREVVADKEDVSIMKYERMDFVVVMAQHYGYEKMLHVQ